MREFLSLIIQSNLFSGMKETQVEAILACLSPRQKSYQKKQYIYQCGDLVDSIGIVLSGSISIIKEDLWGNSNIISKGISGQIFGETYACMAGTLMGVDVVADEKTEVLFLNIKRVLGTCTLACEFHTQLIYNLLNVLACKNLMLNEKLTHMTKRTTREKLLSYLSAESQRQGKSEFVIPYNRNQLANYLSVDRSAMSNELCKMREQGLLKFDKNKFSLQKKYI